MKEKEKRRGRGRRRREEEKKRKRGSIQKGMETHLDYEFYVIMYEFPCLVG